MYINQQSTGYHWIMFRLTGDISNRSAIGTVVRIKATIDGTPVWQMRDISAQGSFLGQNSLDLHFGLGDAVLVDSLEIRFPSGAVFDSTALNVDQLLEITEHCQDTDGDNVDCFDNCPDVMNFDQADADNDGIGDACDDCPNDADNDVDQDGICADADNCPTVTNSDQSDNDNDGIGNACCCIALVGNADGDVDDIVDIRDLVELINALFITFGQFDCPAEANADGDIDGIVDVRDLVALINSLFITFEPLPACG